MKGFLSLSDVRERCREYACLPVRVGLEIFSRTMSPRSRACGIRIPLTPVLQPVCRQRKCRKNLQGRQGRQGQDGPGRRREGVWLVTAANFLSRFPALPVAPGSVVDHLRAWQAGLAWLAQWTTCGRKE